jgi:enoyl-CoA hydratase
MSELLLKAEIAGVQTMTFNRPNARNALSSDLVIEFYDALVAAEANPEIRVVIVTGTDPAFCAGVDLKEAASRGAEYFATYERADCVSKVGMMSKPVIGAINGATFTGGLEIALGCDLLVASKRAVFADTHARVGVPPGGGMTARLPRAVGPAWARRMSLTGEVIDAPTALRIGLVTEVVAHPQLLPRAHALAQAMAEVPPAIAATVRQMYVESAAMSLDPALEIERRIAGEQPADLRGIDERRVAVTARNRVQLGGDNH